MSRMRLLLLTFFLFLVRFSAEAATAFYMPVQFIIENGDYSGSLVVLRKNGETVFTLPGEKNMRLKLDFNEEYLLAFSKAGYITKQIAVDTHVPEERIITGLDPYKIGVRLYKQYEGVNIVVYNQPVASIRYLASLDDLGYDTDYTKSILSLLTETENKLAAKAEAERKELKAAENSTLIFATTNSSGKKEKRPSAETGKELTGKAAPVTQPNPVNKVAEHTGENSNKSLPGSGSDEQDPSKVAGGSDSKPGYDGVEGEDHRIEKHYSGKGQDATTGKILSEETVLKTTEAIHEPHRTITTVTIVKQGRTSVYHQVQYLNGACFYFMNGSTAISPHLFDYFTGTNR